MNQTALHNRLMSSNRRLMWVGIWLEIALLVLFIVITGARAYYGDSLRVSLAITAFIAVCLAVSFRFAGRTERRLTKT